MLFRTRLEAAEVPPRMIRACLFAGVRGPRRPAGCPRCSGSAGGVTATVSPVRLPVPVVEPPRAVRLVGLHPRCPSSCRRCPRTPGRRPPSPSRTWRSTAPAARGRTGRAGRAYSSMFTGSEPRPSEDSIECTRCQVDREVRDRGRRELVPGQDVRQHAVGLGVGQEVGEELRVVEAVFGPAITAVGSSALMRRESWSSPTRTSPGSVA